MIDLSAIALAEPWALWLLVPVPLLIVARLRVRRRSALVWAPLQTAPRRGRSLGPALGLGLEAALAAALVVAVAGPQRVTTLERIGESGLDLALVVDVSASMQAADFPPNRLHVLKELAGELIAGAPGNRFAVFAFAGHVFTHTPLTTDTALLRRQLDGLAFESIDHGASGGTAIGDALVVAADSLLRQRVEGREQLVVLFTDGQNSGGVEPDLAARYLAEERLPLEIVGIGGDEPVPVSVHGRPFITSDDVQLRTRLDDTQLRELARTSGGRYQRARSSEVLAEIFRRLRTMTRGPLERRTEETRESLRPAAAAVLLPLLALWLGVEGWLLRRPLR